MKKKDAFNKLEFGDIFTNAIEALTSQQLRVYHLHLLGWTNQESAEELQIPASQVSQLLYSARRIVREFIQRNYGYAPKSVHKEIVALQEQDPELLSEIFISNRSRTEGRDLDEKQTERSTIIEKLGQLKDACIHAGLMDKDIFRIADLLSSPFAKEYRQELREQLEEYEAAREGLGRLAHARIDFAALRAAIQHAINSQQEQLKSRQNSAQLQEDIAPPMILNLLLKAEEVQRHPTMYKPTVRASEAAQPREWKLVSLDNDEHVILPSEIAQRCYGKARQKVTLRLHCVPVAEEGMFEPQLKVSPPPTQDTLTFQLSFQNGDKRTLTVPVPRRRRSNAFSKPCDPLPAEAFRIDKWEVKVGLRGMKAEAQCMMSDNLHIPMFKGFESEAEYSSVAALSPSIFFPKLYGDGTIPISLKNIREVNTHGTR